MSFPAKGMVEVQRWVLSWGSAVRVIAPKVLTISVEEEIEQMRGLYNE